MLSGCCRVSRESSIYNGVCKLGEVIPDSSTAYCKCSDKDVCIPSNQTFACPTIPKTSSFLSGEDITNMLWQKSQVPLKCLPLQQQTPFEFNKDFTLSPVRWPTPGNVSLDAAIEECKKAIGERFDVNRCVNQTELDLDYLINTCVLEIQVSDNVMVPELSASRGEQQCLIELNSSVEPDLVLLNSLCFTCNNHGNCSEGECICDVGFSGADCSISTLSVPVLQYLNRSGLCDLQKETTSNCLRIGIFGYSFIHSADLVCKLQQSIPVNGNSGISVGEEFVFPAVYFSLHEVWCLAPSLGSFRVSVSNNGMSYSNELIYSVFSSTCYDCEPTGFCSLKLDFCFIGSECVKRGMRNSSDDEQVCEPASEQFKWSALQDYPYVEIIPSLSTILTNTSVVFKCEFLNLTSRDDIAFLIDWFHNDDTDTVEVDDAGVSLMPLSNLPGFKYGSKVSCGIRTCYIGRCKNITSPVRTSNSIIAQIKVKSDDDLFVYEGGNPISIAVTSTIPIIGFCGDTSAEECVVKISAESSLSLFNLCPQVYTEFTNSKLANKCSEIITTNDLLESSVLIRGSVNGIIEGDQQVNISFSANMQRNGSIEEESVGHVMVKVIDRDRFALCSLINPRLRTFDGRIFSNPRYGEFVLYKSKSLQFEVHVVQRSCNGTATCTCAITVLSGDDVILFDMCGPQQDMDVANLLKIQLYVNGELDKNTRVIYTSPGYKVLLPHGTEVMVYPEQIGSLGSINVWIKPSVIDFDNTQGLCGNFDNNQNNDLFLRTTMDGDEQPDPDTFSQSWSVLSLSSHYWGLCEAAATPSDPSIDLFCSCLPDTDCSTSILTKCSSLSLEGEDITGVLLEDGLPPANCDDQRLLWLLNDTFVPQEYRWPTPGDWTLTKAEAYCIKYLLQDSSIGRVCSPLIDTEFIISSCVGDIKIFDSLDWTASHLTDLRLRCIVRLQIDVKLWEFSAPSLTILNQLCYNNCSGNGQCRAGTCICDSSYFGLDCSLSSTDIPPIQPLKDQELCNLETGSCNNIIFRGTIFPTSGLVCVLEKIEKRGTEIVTLDGDEIKHNAVFISEQEVRCHIERVESYRITLRYQTTDWFVHILLVFSPQCYNCDGDTCHIQTGYCLINKKCYKNGEKKSDNSNLICDPEKSTVLWADKSKYPTVNTTPTLLTYFNNITGYFTFDCQWTDDVNNSTDVRLSVRWYVDEKLLLEREADGDLASAIDQRLLSSFKYGEKIYCGLVVCLRDRCNQTTSPLEKSDNYFQSSIKITGDKVVQLKEGGEEEVVNIETNFPPSLLCPKYTGNSSESCSIMIDVKTQQTAQDLICPQNKLRLEQITVIIPDQADSQPENRLLLTDENWQTSHSFMLSATVDGLKDGDQTREVFVKANVPTDGISSMMLIQTLQVTAIDRDAKALCKSVNDPHITTFDGEAYDNFYRGEFVLYKHSSLPQQVNAFFTSCNGKASCNCAVSIRAGHDLLVFDVCANKKTRRQTPLIRRLFHPSNSTKLLKVQRFGKSRKYEVVLPSLTIVTVEVGGKYLNLWIKASAFDFGQTSGLCGTYNGVKEDDFLLRSGEYIDITSDPNSFSVNWRVDKMESLYDGVCGTHSNETISFDPCILTPEKPECLNRMCSDLSRSNGAIDQTEIFYDNFKLESNCQSENRLTFEFDLDYIPQTFSWPTASGWTLVTATGRCRATLLASIGTFSDQCRQLVDFDTILQSCIDDIKITGSTDFLVSSLDDFSLQCRSELETNPATWEITLTGIAQPQFTILQVICPSNCRGRGSCVEGICVCSDGFDGFDCGIQVNQPPVIYYLDSNTCDLSEEECLRVTLYGENFREGYVTCRFQLLQILETKLVLTLTTIDITATLLSDDTITCEVPGPGLYQLSTTNNNITYTQPETFLIFNTKCFVCVKDSCEYVVDRCYINGECYNSGAINPDDSDLLCEPAAEITNWSRKQDYPFLKFSPKISVVKTAREVYVQCEFARVAEVMVQYTVMWSLGGDEYLVEIDDNSTETRLYPYQFPPLNIGDEVSCSIRGCYEDRCNITAGPWKSSPLINTQLKLKSTEVEVTEGEEAKPLVLQNPLPPIFFCPCDHSNQSECRIVINTNSFQRQPLQCGGRPVPQIQFIYNTAEETVHCGIQIVTENWKPEVEIYVKAVMDGLKEGDITEEIILEANLLLFPKSEVNLTEQIGQNSSYQIILKSQVTVIDRDYGAVCKSVNDPHMETFDGIQYDNFLVGEFILYKHKTLPYEVHTFYRGCENKASCNCAVAVKVFDQVIVFDRCGPTKSNRPLPLKPILYAANRGSTLEFRVVRYDDGKVFRIYLPTGTYIVVESERTFINVWMKAGAADFKLTQGLCGYFDGDADNDLRLPDDSLYVWKDGRPVLFSVAWRVEEKDTIYNGACLFEPENSEPTKQTEIFCHCDRGAAPICDHMGYFSCLSFSEISDGSKAAVDITSSLVAISPAKCTSNQPQVLFQYDINYVHSDILTDKFTAEFARTTCMVEFQASASFQLCQGLGNVNIDTILDSCVADALITGSFQFAVESLSDLKQHCLIVIETDTQLWVNNNNTGVLGPPVTILNGLCRNDCSEKGACVAGVCNCEEGYASSDCSVSKSQPPVLDAILEGEICDWRAMSCSQITVLGKGFLDVPTLTCQFPFSAERKAVFVSYEAVICDIQDIKDEQFGVSISNYGNLTSNELYYQVYDGWCFTCSSINVCANITNRCYIGGDCFPAGFYDPQNKFVRVCRPDINQFKWTAVEEIVVVETTRILFTTIIENVIILPKFNITVNGLLFIEKGPAGNLIFLFDGKTYLDFGELLELCPFNLAKCVFGFTLRLNIKITQIVENMFIFSSGAEMPDCTSGIAMYFKNKLLNVAVTTQTKEWTLQVPFSSSQTFTEFIISWHPETGLGLWINKVSVTEHVNVNARTLESTKDCNLFFGRPQVLAGVWGVFQLESLYFFSAQETMLDRIETTVEIPHLTDAPSLSVATVASGEAVFVCEFRPLPRADLNYMVVWYVDDSEVVRSETSGETGEAQLSENYYGKGEIGKRTQCVVIPCLSGDCIGTQGPESYSNVLTAELKIIQSSFEVLEGEMLWIECYLTVPPRLLCDSDKRSKDCFVKLVVDVMSLNLGCPGGRTLPQAVVGLFDSMDEIQPSCDTRITSENWQRPIRIPIKPVLDGVRDKDHQLPVLLSLQISNRNYQTTQTLKSEPLKVKVLDFDLKNYLCKSINDPHETTFDGRNYDNFFEGEFVFYRHTTLPFSVHTFYRSCGGFASCNCGLAVQSGDDVIMIDRCGEESVDTPTLLIKIWLNNHLTPGTKIFYFEKESKYEIILPTGGVVIVLVGQKYLNVIMKPSAVDYRRTVGLCGRFDGNVDNDLTMPDGSVLNTDSSRPDIFSLAWRASMSESLYAGVCPIAEDIGGQIYCDCSLSGDGMCREGLDVQSCVPPEQQVQAGVDITAELLMVAQRPTRCDTGETTVIFQYQFNYTQQTTKWPTPSNINESYAEDLCTDYILANKGALLCKNTLNNLDIQSTVASCKTDIQITDDRSWVEVALLTFLEECRIEVETNTELWTLGPDGQLTFPVNITNSLCLSTCDLHGNCVKGVCICDEGFVGRDCSMPELTAPFLRIIDPVICDIRTPDCRSIRVYGTGFKDSANLVCTFTTKAENKTWTEAATFISSTYVICNFLGGNQGVLNVTLTVGIKEELFGNSLDLLIYDSWCDDCSGEVCFPQPDICTIEGNCLREGFFKPGNPQLVCLPSISKNSWQILSVTDIIVNRLFFGEIVENIVISHSLNFTIYGNLPEVKEGPEGWLALALHGNQYLSLNIPQDNCLGNTEFCKFGFTLQFYISLNSISEKTIIISDGMDENSCYKYGLTILSQNKRLYASVSTKTSIWALSIGGVSVQRYMKVKVSWSIQTGLSLYLNEKVEKRSAFVTVAPEKRLCERPSNFWIGRNETNSYFSISQIQFVTASYTILQEFKDIILDFPTFSNPPVLEVEIEAKSYRNLTCRFRPLGLPDILYTIQWFVGRELRYADNIDDQRTFSNVSPDQLGCLKYNEMVECSVSGCFQSNCDLTRGPSRTSKSIGAQLQVDKDLDDLELIEGGEAKSIRLLSILPPEFLCPSDENGTICHIEARASVQRQVLNRNCPWGNNISPLIFGKPSTNGDSSSCRFRLNSMDWPGSLLLSVRSVANGLKEKEQSYKVNIFSELVCDTQVQQSEIIGVVEVSVRERDSVSVCKSVNDPHITSFDGWSFNNFLEGEFVLYRHRTLPYEVHAFYRNCNGFASCNCAVAVRVDDDVILIDICGPDPDAKNPPKSAQVKIFQNGHLSDGFRILSKGSQYRIILPTGTYITVHQSGKFLNLWVKSSASDHKQTEGLCGVLDGDKTNDITLRDGQLFPGSKGKAPTSFLQAWRVNVKDSLYRGYCGSDVRVLMERDIYCDCMEDGEQRCTTELQYQPCSPTATKRKNKYVDQTEVFLQLAESPVQKCILTELVTEFQFNISWIFQTPFWPTLSNITELEARERCRVHIEGNEGGGKCSQLPDINLQQTLDTCVEDIQITDGFEYLAAALEDLKFRCAVIVTIDVDFWVTTGNQTGPPPQIIGGICPNDCSDHGSCEDGDCVCDTGYLGFDCSVDETVPPVLTLNPDLELCDLRQSDKCLTVLIPGKGFVNSGNLMCHVTVMEKSGQTLISTNTTVMIKGTFISSSLVQCRVTEPNIFTFQISISEGVLSEAYLWVIYDSECEACTISGCQPKSDICKVESVCYRQGYVNPNNPRQICDPIQNTFVTLAATEIVTTITRFWRIVESVLVTSSYNLTVVNNPILVPGPGDRFAVKLNTEGQYINLGKLCTTCLSQPSTCRLGVTFSLKVKVSGVLIEQSNNLYILSTSQSPTATGIFLFLRNNNIYVNIRTTRKQWTVQTNKFTADEYTDIKFSWSSQKGLALYLNGQLADSTERFSQVKAVPEASPICVIGLQQETKLEMEVVLGPILECVEELAIAIDIKTDLLELESRPVIEVVVGNISEEATLLCNFKPIQDEAVQYTLSWNIDGNLPKSTVLPYGIYNDTFTEDLFEYVHYESEILCVVSACYSSNCLNTQSTKESEPFIVSIQVMDAALTIIEGESEGHLKVTCPLPPKRFCPYDTKQNDTCVLMVTIQFEVSKRDRCFDGRVYSQALFSQNQYIDGGRPPCGVYFKGDNWRETLEIPILATHDGIKDNDQNRIVNVYSTILQNNYTFDTFVGTQSLASSVVVTIIDSDRVALCESLNDPHMKTFDGRVYNNYLEGSFVLMKHTHGLYEVHAYYRSCNGFASCNCAISVRSGDDVIVFDRCWAEPKGRSYLDIQIYLNGELTPGTKIFVTNDDTYTIYLPSGTYVIIQDRSYMNLFLNVWVHASPEDFKQTLGLCGTFDDNEATDYTMSNGEIYDGRDAQPNTFSTSWRVEEVDSLFRGYCPDSVEQDKTTQAETLYCSCGIGDTQVCKQGLNRQSCSQPASDPQGSQDITEELLTSAKQPLKCFTQIPQFQILFDIDYRVPVLRWPTPIDGITEEEARTHCIEYLTNDTGANSCRALSSVDFEWTVTSCVLDIQITEDKGWAQTALMNLQQTCLEVNRLAVTHWIITATGEATPPTDIVNNLCLNNCNNKGTCMAGICMCDDDWIGADCSVNPADPPTDVDFLTSGVCDTRRSTCKQVTFTGKGFLRQNNVFCKIETLELLSDGTFSQSGSILTIQGRVLSRSTVVCDLSSLGHFIISINNSPGLTYSSVDGNCYQCSPVCQQKENTCSIDGKCIPADYVDQDTPSQICQPQTSSTELQIISRGSIAIRTYSFIRITLNILLTTGGDFRVYRNPILITGADNESALSLDGISQYAECQISENSCEVNPTNCKLGATISFQVKILTVKTTKFYIFSTGGDEPNGQGVAMYFTRGQLFVTVSTSTAEWTVATSQYSIRSFMDIRISWSIQFGLYLYINNVEVTHTAFYIDKTVTMKTQTSVLFGRTYRQEIYAHIVIQRWSVTEACSQIFESVQATPTREPSQATTEVTTEEVSISTGTSTSSSANVTLSVVESTVQTTSNTTSRSSTPNTATTTEAVTNFSSATDTALPTASSSNVTVNYVSSISTSAATKDSIETTLGSMDTTINSSSSFEEITSATTTPVVESSSTNVSMTTKQSPSVSMETDPATTEVPPISTKTSELTPESTSISQTEEPCITGFLSFPTDPTMLYKLTDDRKNVMFTCSAPSPSVTTFEVEVIWYIGLVKVKSMTLESGILQMSFSSQELSAEQKKEVLISNLYCSSRVKSSRYCETGFGPAVNSTGFGLNITVLTSDIVLTEGGPSRSVTVNTEVSGLFYCPFLASVDGTFQVEAVAEQLTSGEQKCLDNKIIPKIAVKSTATNPSQAVCGVILDSSRQWEISLGAVLDRKYIGRDDRNLVFRGKCVVDKEDRYSLDIKTVKFGVENFDRPSSCESSNDPHIRTFDGFYYDIMRPGEFVLYKNTETEVEVRVFFARCGSGTCNCGAAVRSGDDVFMVNKCNTVRNSNASFPILTDLYLQDDLTPGTRIYRENDGTLFKVLLPTGTVVTIRDDYLSFVTVLVVPSAEEFGKTQGLCGIFDGNQDNDLTDTDKKSYPTSQTTDKDLDKFFESWSVPKSDSIYTGSSNKISIKHPVYCVCVQGQTRQCDYYGHVDRCAVSNGEDITSQLVQAAKDKLSQQQSSVGRKKRQTLSDNTDVFEYDPAYRPPSVTWPVGPGITEDDARRDCQSFVQSSAAYDPCLEIIGETFDRDIINCVTDVLLSGGYMWRQSLVSRVKQRCESELYRNQSLWISRENFQPIIPKNFTDGLCPDDCTDETQGKCVDGICQCEAGYYGYNCGLSLNSVPIVLSELSDLTCVNTSTSCSSVQLFGTNFQNISTLTCHFTKVQVNDDGYNTIGDDITVDSGSFISRYQVECDLPTPSSYLVTISNEGKTISQSGALFILHDVCYTCSVNPAKCSVKSDMCVIEDTCYSLGYNQTSCHICQPSLSATTWSIPTDACFIGERCYNRNDQDETDNCEICEPDTSKNTWTRSKEPLCVKEGTSGTDVSNLLTIALPSSIAVVVLIVVSIFLACMFYRTRRAAKALASSDSTDSMNRSHVYDNSFGFRSNKSFYFTDRERYLD